MHVLCYNNRSTIYEEIILASGVTQLKSIFERILCYGESAKNTFAT